VLRLESGEVIDPITAEIINAALVYASEEMGLALRNSAYSPNIKERLDHSCALFDRHGRLIAQAEHIPVHLGSLPWGLKRMLEIVEREHGGVREGEMWVANDPYVTARISTTSRCCARSSIAGSWPDLRQ